MASEVGVLDIDPAKIVRKGRLQPGRMFLIDTAFGRIVEDDEIKQALAEAQPYADWLRKASSSSASCPNASTWSSATRVCCVASRCSVTPTRN
jgi:glutamate synthase (NADPH/NADH) large chain